MPVASRKSSVSRTLLDVRSQELRLAADERDLQQSTDYNSIMRVHVRLALVVVLSGAAACNRTPVPAGSDQPADAQRTATPASAQAASEQRQAAPPSDAVFTGNIVETMNAGGYTYARLQNGSAEAWIAAPEFDAKQGEQISAALDMPMRDFQSKTLNRTFPLLYFVQEVGRNGKPLSSRPQGAPPSLMNSHGETAAAPAVQKLEPPAGGLSVADVFARKAELSGRNVIVRGTVVKFNGGIMDRNWFHIQDGSGSAAAKDNDLTVTSTAEVKVGDIVTVAGVLGTGRDFGAGYAYDAILEQAAVTGR